MLGTEGWLGWGCGWMEGVAGRRRTLHRSDCCCPLPCNKPNKLHALLAAAGEDGKYDLAFKSKDNDGSFVSLAVRYCFRAAVLCGAH